MTYAALAGTHSPSAIESAVFSPVIESWAWPSAPGDMPFASWAESGGEVPAGLETGRYTPLAESIGSLAVAAQVQLMSEVAPGEWRAASQRNIAILGQAASFLQGMSERTEAQTGRSLSRRMQAAHEGDYSAFKSVQADVASDIVEMAMKTGARMECEADIVGGRVVRDGQDTAERQFNTRTTYSYRFRGLDEMSAAEGQNALVLEQAIATGAFRRGDVMVECSLVPEASHADLKGSGLFLREVLAIIRLSRLDGRGKLVIESYLVGGTEQNKLPPLNTLRTKDAEDEAEQLALANRFDIRVFRRLLHRLGVSGAEQMGAADILASPLFIRGKGGREQMDGIDFAMLYDEVANETLGLPTMMGDPGLYGRTAGKSQRPLTRADYENHFAQVDRLRKSLESLSEEVAQVCVGHWRDVSGDDYAAGRLMHKMSEDAVLTYIAQRIAAKASQPEAFEQAFGGVMMPDLSVLGGQTYNHLLDFAYHLRRNDFEAASKSFAEASRTKQGTGCATGQRSESQNGEAAKESGVAGSEGQSPSSDKKDEGDGLGDRVFKCKNGHVNVRPRGRLLKKCWMPACDPPGKAGQSVGCK